MTLTNKKHLPQIGVFCYHSYMHTEYFTSLEAYEDIEAHKSALLNNIDYDKVIMQKAIEIVEEYHDTPRTLYPGNYNRHPIRVARILVEEFGVKNTTTILIALCHDLGEWTEYNLENLEKEFSAEVRTGVETLTWNRNDTWEDFFQNIIASDNDDLIKIKIADKLDNNRAAVFSTDESEKRKARDKTELIMRPFVENRFPEYWKKLEKSLEALT